MTGPQNRDASRSGTLVSSAVALLVLTSGACTPGSGLTFAADRPFTAGEDTGSSVFGSYLAGNFAHRTGDVTAAAEFLDLARKGDPENLRLLQRTFFLRLTEGAFDEALALAADLERKKKTMQLAILLRAADALKRQDFSEARGQLNHLASRGHSSLLLPLFDIWLAVGEKDTDLLQRALKKLGSRKGFESIQQLHGMLAFDVLGLEAEADRWQNQTIARGTPSIRFALLIADRLARQGHKARALRVLDKASKRIPESMAVTVFREALDAGTDRPAMIGSAAAGLAEGMFDIATMVYQSEQSIGLAFAYTQLALFLQPDFDVALLLCAEILGENERNDAAAAMLQRVSTTSPYRWMADLRYAEALIKTSRFAEAETFLEDLARTHPTRSEPLIELGDMYRRQQEFMKAVTAYDRAFDRIPTLKTEHWFLHYVRGIALERSKQWKRAEKDFLAALSFEPDQPLVLNYLGYSWVDQGIHLERARELIERAVALAPNDGYIIDSLGWALYQFGEYEDAVQQLEKAVELRPGDPILNDHLGDAYWQTGRKMEAVYQWKRSLAFDPEPEAEALTREKLLNGLP